FKYKFSLENVTPDQDLELINKSAVANNLISPTRDIGVEISRKFSVKSVKADCSVAVVNGSGSNQVDENDYKSIVGRVIFTPFKGFNVGGSVYDGKTTDASNVTKDRTGFEAKYEIEKLFCKTEYVFGKDNDVKKVGYYATAGYTIKPSVVVLVRYDEWDPSLKVAGAKNSRWTFGFNYFLDKNVLLRNNYERKMESPSIKNNLIMSELQVKF
ncbi:MAG: porin, partial [Elusimicrobiota bacterium]|nr:porin [Elusimicrobiota bacterium]